MVVPCIFCEFIEAPTSVPVVHEDDHTFAFLSNAPATEGHVLVLPRRHAEDLWSISADQAAGVMRSVHQVAALVRRQLEPDGLTLLQNNRPAGWQTVFHFHVHVIPRYEDDGLRYPLPTEPVPPEALHEAHGKLTARRWDPLSVPAPLKPLD